MECVHISVMPKIQTIVDQMGGLHHRTEGSETVANSSLSFVSITEDLNGTMVECTDGTDIIGSKTICILGIII